MRLRLGLRVLGFKTLIPPTASTLTRRGRGRAVEWQEAEEAKGRPEHPLAPVAPFSLSWPAATRAQALASASHLCAPPTRLPGLCAQYGGDLRSLPHNTATCPASWLIWAVHMTQALPLVT